jgi:carboxymethylenebutenolidase
MASYDGILAETINIQGHDGDEIPAYLARRLGPGPFPSVVVIHHMPGWDDASKEITRRFAASGYNAICPHLHHREAPDASPEDAAAAARAAGGVPDARLVGDIAASVRYLRWEPNANGKVGVIGYCSGGRQAYLVAATLDVDAAVVCYGGRIVAGPDEVDERRPVAPIDMTDRISCPVLGLFGDEDRNPSPAHVDRIEKELKDHGKVFEIHRYPNAGHAFFSVDRPSYRVEAANDGWQRIFEFYGTHLS